MFDVQRFPPGFESSDELRSDFMRALVLHLIEIADSPVAQLASKDQSDIPLTLIRYWHDPDDLPDDVQACLSTWDCMSKLGVNVRFFCDESAAAFIAANYGSNERQAFARCRHPAMRCDYLRLCYILAKGGLYADADDVLLRPSIEPYRGTCLKLQPLCYDIETGQMLPTQEIWRADLQSRGRIFYVNNNPIAAPPGHPVLQKALSRATKRLLQRGTLPEIQSTTGPGNLTAVLVAHARDLIAAGQAFDFEILQDWDSIATTRWDLAYRNDDRNWRNMRFD